MNSVYNLIINLMKSLGSAGLIINCLLIIVESIIPPLPLSLFITILFVNYGNIFGFLIGWIFNVIGCILSFFLFQTVLKKSVDKKIRKNKFANKLFKIVDNISFSKLVLLIAIPFTPAFAINIVSGLSNMDIKKFIKAIIIGKPVMIFFWGYIGTSLIESIKNPIVLIKIIILLLVVYIISKIVNKKFHLD